MAKAGRPKGWSPKTGWSKSGSRDQAQERRTLARETFEGLCCAQIERIERTLAGRYGFDYDGDVSSCSVGKIAAKNRSWLLPQNDGMSRKTIYQDCAREVRK